jgi:NAD(P)-dependent dehydrogenase (short-subunit alcohol dehydrogenase family)
VERTGRGGTERLAGKLALVTGAASGIGRATAIRFVAEGARVACLDRDAVQLDRLVTELPGAIAIEADVTNEAAVANAVLYAETQLGGLNTLVANAAIQLFGSSGDMPATELPLDRWNRTMAVNLTGVFLTCKYGIAALLRAGGGSVICTGSPTGLYGLAPGFTAYSASKGGVYALARVLASDFARQGVRVNVVIPGFTDTPLVREVFENTQALETRLSTIPMGRAGKPEEIASMIAFLASDDASYATGAAFTVDGGLTAI